MSMDFVFSSLLNPTDPARLHAELWGDYVSKVMSCYVQILLGLLVVARDLFGSSIQCFALDLADAHLTGNATFANNSHNGHRIAFENLGAYARQLAQFVNIYCETKAYSSAENSIFSYRLFALFLGFQAVILYIPILVWNITTARKIICNIRFIAHDVEMLYKCWRGEWLAERGKYVPKELTYIIEQWSKSTDLCVQYFFKQFASWILTIAFLLAYHLSGFFTIDAISSEFVCDVEGKFKVNCTVPSATIYRLVWGFNMSLLYLNLIIVSYNALSCLVVPCCEKMRICCVKVPCCACAKVPCCAQVLHCAKLVCCSKVWVFETLVDLDLEEDLGSFKFVPDHRIMDKFFQANVETVDKLSYIKAFPNCQVPTNTQLYLEAETGL